MRLRLISGAFSEGDGSFGTVAAFAALTMRIRFRY
jgi:hypothetical protein